MNFKTIKKTLAVAAASAMIACFGMTSFAAAPTVTGGSSTAKTGDTVSYTVAVSGGDLGLQGSISTTGLKFVSVSGGFSSTEKTAMIAIPANQLSSVTYTYEVTAAEGETFSFTIGNLTISNSNNDPITSDPVTVSNTVAAATDPTDATSTPTTNDGGNAGGSTGGNAGDAVAGGTVAPTEEGKAPKTGDMGAVQLIKSLFR